MPKRKLAPHSEEPFDIVSVRLPRSIVIYADDTADKHLSNRSYVLRTLIVDGLRARGVVQTLAEMDAAEADAA